MEFIILIILIIGLIFIGIWMKSNAKWDGRFTINDLIKERGGTVINIEKASVLDHIIYSGKLGNNHASFYHVKYVDNNGLEKECVVRQILLTAPTIFKESISRQSKK